MSLSEERPRTQAFDINAAIHAPFDGLDEDKLKDKVIAFVDEAGLNDDEVYFLKAGFIAQSDEAFTGDPNDGPFQLTLTQPEKTCLREEKTRRWKHPGALWRLVALCALGAAVQGWDEAAVDGGMSRQQVGDMLAIQLSYRANVNESANILHMGLWHWQFSKGAEQA